VKRLPTLLAAVAACLLTLSGCGFRGLYSANLPGGANVGSHPYRVVAYFSDVLDLVPQSAVKVNDVAVGRVVAIRLSRAGDRTGDAAMTGWTARVVLEVNGSVRLPSNARAAVKMTSLLGEKYVTLEQPSTQPARSELRNGSVIPITRTDTAPDVEEVLGALSLLLNGGGLAQLHVITTELNKALDGHEGAVRDLLGQLNTFVGTLDRQKSDIVNALQALDHLAATLDRQRHTIETTLDTFPPALKVLSDERGDLVTMLSALAHLGSVATSVVDGTEQNLVSSLRSLSPVLTQLTAAGRNLPEALRVAATFPFPVGASRNFIRGDYANLHLFLDLNLSNELCGLNKNLCEITPSSQSARPLTADSPAGSTAEQLVRPALLGAGG
jgi:phospholipid/cholesterol/gamma-HCH transport system substrate-binding protein